MLASIAGDGQVGSRRPGRLRAEAADPQPASSLRFTYPGELLGAADAGCTEAASHQ